MKILYITPSISGNGGVERVLAIRTKYLIDRYGYDINFFTYDFSLKPTFFDFHPKVKIQNGALKGNKILKILHYYNQVKEQIRNIQPDIIVICDFGWKGFCFNYFVNTKIPVVFEVHGSMYNETKPAKILFLNNIRAKVRKWLLSKFQNVVYLSEESEKEWGYKGIVIPNILSYLNCSQSDLEAKKVIVIARHSYEKGIDRLLAIWEKITKKHPDWKLEIFGDGILFEDNLKLSQKLKITSTVEFYKPLKDIQKKYLDSSIYLMTSRQEGLPMSLLEAMSFGLPIVAYDCPVGPKAIIENNVNGFLIREADQDSFVQKTLELIENKELRSIIGMQAKKSAQKYDPIQIVQKWDEFFTSLFSK